MESEDRLDRVAAAVDYLMEKEGMTYCYDCQTWYIKGTDCNPYCFGTR